MEHGEEEWLERSVADRKILVLAMEQGYVCEVLPASFIITGTGRHQDFPDLDRTTAREALRQLIERGLVGTYMLNSDDEHLGDAAIESVQRDAVWTSPGSGGLCLFLTKSGEQAVGIG